MAPNRTKHSSPAALKQCALVFSLNRWRQGERFASTVSRVVSGTCTVGALTHTDKHTVDKKVPKFLIRVSHGASKYALMVMRKDDCGGPRWILMVYHTLLYSWAWTHVIRSETFCGVASIGLLSVTVQAVRMLLGLKIDTLIASNLGVIKIRAPSVLRLSVLRIVPIIQ